MNKEKQTLQEQYEAARERAIHYQEIAASLMEDPGIRLYRKVLRRKGRDLFGDLRPIVTSETSKMQCTVDNVAYRGDQVVIRGWAVDLNGIAPSIMVREGSRILTAKIDWYIRHDITELFDLGDQVESGFSIRIPLQAISKDRIQVELENELGVLPVEVFIEQDPQKRAELKYPSPIGAGDPTGYDDWFREQRVTETELGEQRRFKLPTMPLLSICIPLYETDESYFLDLMDSLLAQSYTRIEICLADGSGTDRLGQLLQTHYPEEKRIRYCHLEKNLGISDNTNAAFKMATGEFIMLCDHDDVMEPNACFEIAKCISEDPEIDCIYTDEDKITMDGSAYFSPNLKPDYNPDLLRSNNYITHIFCFRRSLLDVLKGEDRAYDGAQDYDFILRCTEVSGKIHHIPKILYHWRAHPESTAGNPESKMYAYENGRKALAAHYERMGIEAKPELSEDIGSYVSRYEHKDQEMISIIIPNKDQKDVLQRAVESILKKTTWKNYEILILENNSETEEIFEYYRTLTERYPQIRVIRYEGSFHYSKINNFAVSHSKGELLLFLNNDTEVLTDHWLESLAGYCKRSDVGAVGARLYYPNDTLQHCGIVVGLGGVAGHILAGESRDSGGYFGRIHKTQDVSAVTGACLMTPKERFLEVGGFSEELAIAYNDVDYCLKLREQGYHVVYDAATVLYHYESLTRGSDEAKDLKKHERQRREAAQFRGRWKEILVKGDPYFNPNLDYYSSEFVLAGTVPEKEKNLEYLE